MCCFSLVINTDEFPVRGGRRQILSQQHFFGQDHVTEATIHVTVQCSVLYVPNPKRSRLSLTFLINLEAVWGNVGLSEALGKQTEANSGAAPELRDFGCFHHFKA